MRYINFNNHSFTRLITLSLILLSLLSCIQPSSTWDSTISETDKARFLLKRLTDYYKKATANEDFENLINIKQEIKWVKRLDPMQIDDAKNLSNKIDNTIKEIKAIKLKRIEYYKSKNWFVGATIEYQKIIIIDPFNKDARSYFKEKKGDIKNYIKERKAKAKELLSKKYFLAAAKELKRLPDLIPNDFETRQLLARSERLKQQKIRHLYKLAQELMEEENYTKVISTTNKILKLDPDNRQTRLLKKDAAKFSKSTKSTKSTTKKSNTKKHSNKKEDLSRYNVYYNTALKYFNDKQYAEARDEIETFLSFTSTQDAVNLLAKINKSLKSQIKTMLDDAVLQYNSQNYEKALDLFKDILYLDPKNEAATDYKVRIEKMMKAFE